MGARDQVRDRNASLGFWFLLEVEAQISALLAKEEKFIRGDAWYNG